MRKPKSLQHGDLVALVHPAQHLPERFAKQVGYIQEYLSQLGYQVTMGYASQPTASIYQRASDLNAAFANNEVKAVFPVCGGEAIYEILPHVDYKTVAENPKIFCGFSALSPLLLAIVAKAGAVSFFGPHLTFVNPKASFQETQFTVKSFWNMLTWGWCGRSGLDVTEKACFFRVPRVGVAKINNIYLDPNRIRQPERRDNFYLRSTTKERVSGPLIITSLQSLWRMSKEYVPDLRGTILVLDVFDIPFGTVCKLINNLRGYISRCSALVFSTLAERRDRKYQQFPELANPKTVQRFIQQLSAELHGKPVLFGLPIGHCVYRLTMPLGVRIAIDTESGTITFLEKPFR